MSVYVDDMRANFGRMVMCHMIADTEAELHAMADKIGVARRWYQGDHYDIALSKRAIAVEHGAVEITLKQCGCMSALQKRGLPMGDPATAEERFKALVRERAAARAAAKTAADLEHDIKDRRLLKL